MLRTPAEDTAALLRETVHAGLPLMLPGALELRVVRPATQPASRTAAPVRSQAHPVVIGNRERLEYEREGGGAPSQRRLARHQTILSRLWHCLSHPSNLSTLWHPLPEER